MRIKRRLRSRVAAAFAVFGGLVSLLQASGLYVAFHNLEERLIDDTLSAELQDYAERRERNPRSVPEMTTTIRAYVMPSHGLQRVPDEVEDLPPGRHQVVIDGTPFRAAVADHGRERFAILYNESQLREREKGLVILLAGGALVMTVLSAVAGFWLAGRVIAPVTELVGRVARLRPEDRPEPLADRYPWDEVRELAAKFDDYLARLRAFIERERSFTADVSHELRTPLAVLNGAAEVLLADPNLPDKARDRVCRMARAGDEMAEIISTLLVLAREEGDSGDRSAHCDVETVLRETADKLREGLENKPIVLQLEVQGRPRVRVERTVLAMTVGNLLRNAVGHTDHGEVRATLDENGLTVADHGPGIAAEELPRVFDRYYRGGKSTGTGIGLALVKRICDRYGWSITIESQPAEGTTTRLDFRTTA